MMSMSASWIGDLLRIDAYKPEPECPARDRGVAMLLTAEQAEALRRVIDAGPENNPPC
jgi:hypothetical protein